MSEGRHPGNNRPRQAASCHPDLPQHARGMCVSCYGKAWKKDNRSSQPSDAQKQRSHWLRRYGLSVEDFEGLAERQGQRCAICRQDRPLVVDHDHETGAVRGLLCRQCNSGLGQFGDDPLLVEIALRYVS